MRIYGIGVETDVGRRVVKLSAPLDVDLLSDTSTSVLVDALLDLVRRLDRDLAQARVGDRDLGVIGQAGKWWTSGADRSPTHVEGLPRGLAEAVVQLADACVVGLPCDRHGGVVHGQEAEELRAGVERILHATVDVIEDDSSFVLSQLRRSLVFLLDHVDARDSLAFREATDDARETVDASSPRGADPDEDDVRRLRRAARRTFFAACSPGDKIAWGSRHSPRSGIIQKIEDDYVTILDDGWEADPPLCVYTPPFVARLQIDYMERLRLLKKAVP